MSPQSPSCPEGIEVPDSFTSLQLPKLTQTWRSPLRSVERGTGGPGGQAVAAWRSSHVPETHLCPWDGKKPDRAGWTVEGPRRKGRRAPVLPCGMGCWMLLGVTW